MLKDFNEKLQTEKVLLQKFSKVSNLKFTSEFINIQKKIERLVYCRIPETSGLPHFFGETVDENANLEGIYYHNKLIFQEVTRPSSGNHATGLALGSPLQVITGRVWLPALGRP